MELRKFPVEHVRIGKKATEIIIRAVKEEILFNIKKQIVIGSCSNPNSKVFNDLNGHAIHFIMIYFHAKNYR